MNLSVLKNRNNKVSNKKEVEAKEVLIEEEVEEYEEVVPERPIRKKKVRKPVPQYYDEDLYEDEEPEEEEYQEYEVRRPSRPVRPRRPSRPVATRQLEPISYYDNDDYEEDYRPVQEPARRPIKPVTTLATMSTPLSQAELKQHIVEALGLTTFTSVEVYQQKYLNVEPLTFEIKDLNGSISTKLESIERETGLSVIPFKLAGLNNFISEIPGYTIIEKDGDKFVSATAHIANSTRVNKYIEEWKTTLQAGLKVDCPLEIEYTTSEKTYKVCSLNQYEIDYLQTLFKNYGAVGYILDGAPHMAIGY